MAHVTVLGSFVIDLITRSHRLPTQGETLFAHHFESGAGGKGQNQAVQSHLMGVPTTFICKLGTHDPLNRIGTTFWTSIDFNPTIFYTDTANTGCASIQVDSEGHNQIAVYLGANNTFTNDEIKNALSNIEKSQHLLLQSEINADAIEYAVALSSHAGTRIVYNPAPYRDLSPELLQRLFLITPNESEAAALLGFSSITLDNCLDAAKALCQMGPEHAIITMGSLGCCFATKQEACFFPAFRVNAIDTVGAGDSFNGALVAMMAKGLSISDAIPYAMAASALSVCHTGSASSMQSYSAVQSFLMEHT